MAFQSWLLKQPDRASTVIRDMSKRSVNSLVKAGREYMAARNVAIENGLLGAGITVRRAQNGDLMIPATAVGLKPRGDFGQEISVKEAVKRGLISFNE